MPRRKSRVVKKSRRPKVSRRGILKKKKNRTKLSNRKRVAFSVPRLEGGRNNETENEPGNEIKEMLGEMLKNKEKNETEQEPGNEIEEMLGDMAKTRDLQEIYEILADEKSLRKKTYDEVNILKKRITELFTEKNLADFLKKIESMSKEELQKIARSCYKYKNLINDPQNYHDFEGHHIKYTAFFEELDRKITKKLEQLQERDYTEDLRALDTWRAEASGFDSNYKIRR